ncbi:F-box/kelch-repeat protein At3g23880-like [Apium graveolens]|uniref:F-box/kelch-repeat protein At3g23880-like n=1 Tax=Apium graveolens TaxID=4045 RepID=UPI003D7C07C1
MSSSQCNNNNNNNEFTDDLLTKILISLPVKSLLICRAVSKPWCSLISSPTFIKSHLGHAISRPGADETLIVQDFDGLFERNHIISFLNLRAPKPQVTLDHPFSKQGQSRIKLVGCCRGIVCVSVADYDSNELSLKSYDERLPVMYLWNPVTRRIKCVPMHNVHYDCMNEVVQGFGYDCVNDDFKIVRVVTYQYRVEFEEDVDEVEEVDAEVRVDVEVYSVKLDAWRKLGEDCMPEEIVEFQTANYDICVDGVLCCIAEGFCGVMAFDLNREVFNCDVEFPVHSKFGRIISIGDSAICFIALEEFSDEFKFWKLDDVECLRGGEAEASWSLMVSINVDFDCVPYSYHGCGNFVLLIDGPGWVLYNSDKKEATNLPIRKLWRQNFRYTESLVTIPGSKQVRLNDIEAEGRSENEDESESEDECESEDRDGDQVKDEVQVEGEDK